MKEKNYYEILVPCPMCGSKHLSITHWTMGCFTALFAIECYDCGYRLEGKSRKSVLKRWGLKKK
jgi:DNA-directed RNA polymerase subunit RPC12/RpoP